MTVRCTYIDYNATALLRPEARDAMTAAMDVDGNSSSVHAEGRRARAVVERARGQVALMLGCEADQIAFTSGATEANNWVVKSAWRGVIISAVEHPSVLEPARVHWGDRLRIVGVHASGVVDLEDLSRALEAHAGGSGSGKVLVSIQAANGETGVIQPLADIYALVSAHDGVLHVDAAQHKGDHAALFGECRPDLVSLSAHKLGGPKGVGALVFYGTQDVPALLHGGGQEVQRRAGTENVVGIAGFGAAAESAVCHRLDESGKVVSLRDQFERQLRNTFADAVILGDGAQRMANTSLFAIKGLKAETLVMALDLKGVAVSAGSACSSGKVAASHVVMAMWDDPELAQASVRVSFGWASVLEDVQRAIDAIVEVSSRLLRETRMQKKTA